MSLLFSDDKRSMLQNLMRLKAASGGGSMTEYTVTGNPVTFATDVARALTAFTIPFTSTNGLTGLNVTHCGKNLLDIDRTIGSPNPTTVSGATSPRIMDCTHFFVGIRSDNYYYKNYVPIATVSDGTITVQSSNNNDYGIGFPVPVIGGQKYTLSFVAQNTLISFGYYDKDWNYLSTSSSFFNGSPVTITIPDSASYAVIVFRSTVGTPYTYSNVQFEVGETATDYVQYAGTTYPVTFPAGAGSVTAGSFDAVTGVLTTTSPAAGTYQLSPLVVQTLIGTNTVWSDTNGTNSITYLKSRT